MRNLSLIFTMMLTLSANAVETKVTGQLKAIEAQVSPERLGTIQGS
ncbi:hypothetical protein [Vibrio nomapromontoriensis]